MVGICRPDKFEVKMDNNIPIRIGSAQRKEFEMAESVYKIIELVGTSTESWEKAAAAAVELAGKSLKDLRIAEVTSLDMQLEDNKVVTYRAKVKVSFKYHKEFD
jgi:dodecin